MRAVLHALMILICAGPASAQLLYVRAPVSIENAELDGNPVSFPISETIVGGVGSCGFGTGGELEIDIVDHGIEVAFDGAANNGDCTTSATLRFDLVLEVPVLSEESTTHVYLVAEVGPNSLVFSPFQPGSFGSARMGFSPGVSGSSTQSPQPIDPGLENIHFRWDGDGTTPPVFVHESGATRISPLFPGDTVRIPTILSVSLTTTSGVSSGAFSARYEIRARFPQPVPAPSGSLSLPIGALGLAGLSIWRGGA